MSGTKLPEVHRVRKVLDQNLRPEKQHAMPKKGATEKPRTGQGRAGLRRKPEPDHINQPSDVTRRISERSKIVTGKTKMSRYHLMLLEYFSVAFSLIVITLQASSSP